ncbi:hypothetical protein HPP92_011969 [Vanilla planifolia]|uniref:Uncharacterized protein n=1 Tax=Vanilla planifolia TaxID=51239 RepID=A0A835R9H9_VANPL|nr:hypothetical protein HPP92_011969 [Vanilla planifolia]
MLFAEAMGTSTVRSSLEVMLDDIKRREEQPKDLPPELPSRPTSRGRRPSPRRFLPVNLAVTSGGQETQSISERIDEAKIPDMSSTFGCMELAKPSTDELQGNPVTDGLGNYGERAVVGGAVESELRSSFAIYLGEHFKNREAMDYFLKKKLPVWCWLEEEKWEQGQIHSVSIRDAQVLTSSGRVLKLPMESIVPANPEVNGSVNDITQLSYLNEPSILHTLKCRYYQDKIFIKAGHVLVALNPFKDLSACRSDSFAACSQKVGETPHVYAVADHAFREILRGAGNQSIIISGLSGSGKTETSKLATEHLVMMGSINGIDLKFLNANLIRESFGNAKALENDNSTRHGKLTEIHFSELGKVCGAIIETYLLEKSRVVQRAVGERSFHIFYQLCAGAPPCLKEKLKLKAANEYEYLKKSKCLRIEGIDDAQRFQLLMEALGNINISKEDQENIFSILAAVLWLGNVGFSAVNNGKLVEVNLDEGLTNAANLLGCEANDLVLALSTQRHCLASDDVIPNLTFSQAVETRDAMAISIYSSLFDWIALQINKSLQIGKNHTGNSISILDMCGFDFLQKNNFEQFCINYANERLHQHFISHLFKREQEEYILEGVDWCNIGFVDNIECVNLFEKEPQGILFLLDEESTSSNATDFTFFNKLKQQLHDNPCFKGERSSFRIHHYAGEVLYNTCGFLKSNTEMLHKDSIKPLLQCSKQLCWLFSSLNGTTSTVQRAAAKLKDQISKLMAKLENTNPHFISCIKPNRKQLPGIYEEDFVMQQFRCFSLLETIKMSRLGYSTKMTHEGFAERYQCLLMESSQSVDPLSVSVAVLERCNILPVMYQVGFTMIFFRTGQIVALETARACKLRGIVCAQKLFRGYHARCTFKDIKKGITTLQSFIRAQATRCEFQYLVTRQRAVFVIQRHVKHWVARKTLAEHQRYITILQSVIRGWLVRKQFSEWKNLEEMKFHHANAPGDQNKNISELKHNQQQPLLQPSTVAELNNRLLKAEAELGCKEEENSSLREQLQQYRLRWSDYDAKMKSMEEVWQKQIASLQMSLAAAKKCLASNDLAGLAGRPDASPTYQFFDSEDAMSIETYTTEGTPAKPPRASGGGLDAAAGSARNAISHLVKEFKERRKVFEDDADFLVEVKSGQLVSNVDPEKELRNLKVQFASWKKDYKVRLRETKLAIQQIGNLGKGKTRRRWWGKRDTK